jgi:F-type H+-transporting ATPase subunit gamma
MPSLIDIRRRIRSVRNTQQITKAMKMVSAAKLRRAQDRVIASRPYGAMLQKMLENVAAAARGDERVAGNPLLREREENRIQLILVTADRGLAGAFNSNVIKGAQRFMEASRTAQFGIEAVGRKGRDFFRKRNFRLTGDYTGITEKIQYSHAHEVARKVLDRFAKEEIDAVYLIYNEFKSVMTQELRVIRILPVAVPEHRERIEYLYEQPPQELLQTLLPRYVEVEIYRAMIESAAAQQAARMTAMESATSNAGDMIDRLTLYMNRVRQASITREIIEVVSGASALE